MIKKLSILLSFFLLACGVDFDNYMPNDQVTFKNMPPEIIGTYNFSDSTFGDKSDLLFFNEAYFYDKLNTRDSLHLVSGQLIISKKTVKYNLTLAGYYNMSKFDTVELINRIKTKNRYIKGKYIVFTDSIATTIINMSTKDKLTMLDGKFYFNHMVNKKDWEVYQFEKINGSVYSINITNNTDRDNLIDTTNMDWKDISPIVHLSNTQFKDFVERGGFRKRFRFTKLQ